MLAEFSIVPIGAGESVSVYVSECIRIVDESDLDYRLNPMGTVVEGEYDEVMAVISSCHKKVAGMCDRVITTIRIDDRKGAVDTIRSKVESVERKSGKKAEKIEGLYAAWNAQVHGHAPERTPEAYQDYHQCGAEEQGDSNPLVHVCSQYRAEEHPSGRYEQTERLQDHACVSSFGGVRRAVYDRAEH